MLQQKLRQGSVQRSVLCKPNRRDLSVRYQPPSSAVAASELDLIQRFSEVVPDSAPVAQALYKPKAATVSCNVLNGIVAAESLGLKPYENAINTAMNFDRCRALPSPAERAQCQLDKALVNVGALFAKDVEGRVCTQVDPRLNTADQMVAKVDQLLALYKENGVAENKLIFRLPATWAGIQAAKQLEAKGVATQVFLVFSLVQAVAAAQAGVSVIQPSVGRIRDIYAKYPNMIRDALGPRQDSGLISSEDPGVTLVQLIYTYIKKYHPKTKIMVTGIRNREDATSVSGADYLVVPTKVLSQLASQPTTAGYNDGMSSMQGGDEAGPALSPKAAKASDMPQVPAVDEATFNNGLGMAAAELLKSGLQQQIADAERLLPHFQKSTKASSSL